MIPTDGDAHSSWSEHGASGIGIQVPPPSLVDQPAHDRGTSPLPALPAHAKSASTYWSGSNGFTM
jgi:hypothetical protein